MVLTLKLKVNSMEKESHETDNMGTKDLEILKMHRNLELNNTERVPLLSVGRLVASPETPAEE